MRSVRAVGGLETLDGGDEDIAQGYYSPELAGELYGGGAFNTG